MTARTSQAAFAVNFPDGRCASAELFRSAWTCSMTACARWTLSAVTVSAMSSSVVVKNAVRHEALLFRMEVRDLHRLVVAAAG